MQIPQEHSQHLICTQDPRILLPVSPGPAPESWKTADNHNLFMTSPGHYRFRVGEHSPLVHHTFRIATEQDLIDHRAFSLSKEIVDRIQQNTLTQDALYKIRDLINDPKNHIGNHHGHGHGYPVHPS